MNVQAGSVSFSCLYLLAEGPATTADVTAETGLTARHANAYMSRHANMQRVERVPFRLGQCRSLWQLTDAGRKAIAAALAQVRS